jgi:hypothetical protein
MIVNKPYPGQREPSCIHDHHQPAGMCTECSKRPEVIEWHRANKQLIAMQPVREIIEHWRRLGLL